MFVRDARTETPSAAEVGEVVACDSVETLDFGGNGTQQMNLEGESDDA